ncbi:SDR family NAD(P)-dependent oxidoreductase [Shimia ponticola]|uniref:SDR family NAD(P)-dependent oxidoreductase n=1 Tax=Shimia ponticola TaxID=2582893 RepID=UPI0011BE23D6|nr:SDR family NAD(P)-dependent oxidoreductase [Shimia ponticola]
MRKTILITGATDGIGLLTAQNLIDAEHEVILHGRSQAKLDAALNSLSAPAKGFLADLSSLEAAAQMAKEVTAQHAKIDVLINNAGVYKTAEPILPNGHDIRFVVNTLAPYLLTKALLPRIPTDGRIINLSSAAQAPVSREALAGTRHVGDFEAYAQSKLAITVWSAELAKSLPEGPVVISVNPGSLLATKMVKEGFGVAGHDLNIGADILCALALDAQFEGASGKYWDNDAGRFSAPHEWAQDRTAVAGMMATLEDLIGSD